MMICCLAVTMGLRAHATNVPRGLGGDSTSGGGLSVSTEPAEADVFIDGKMMGRTPLLFPGIRAGNRVLRIAKSGFCDVTDSVDIFEGALISRAVRLDSACGLVVRSEPDSAAVYVENVFVGRSPLRITNQRKGWKTIKVMKVNSAPWEDYVYCSPGNLIVVNAVLKSKFGTLSLDVFSDDIDVMIDGKVAGRGSLRDYMIAGGWHDVGARSADSLRSVVEPFYFKPGESVHLQARFGERSWKALAYSAALPGLGQILDGSTEEGVAMMSGFAATGEYVLVMHIYYLGKVSEFNDAHAAYMGLRSEDAALIAGNDLTAKYQAIHDASRARTIGWAVAGAVYVYSLVDAFLNHSHVNMISPTAMESIIRQGPDISLSGSGGQITFRIGI